MTAFALILILRTYVQLSLIMQGTFGALFESLSGGAGREKKGAKATPPPRKARRDLEGIESLEPEPVALRMRRDICSEFADAPDFCMSTGLPAFSKSIIFFKRDFFLLIGGFIPITLGFSIGGEFNVMIQLDFCLLTLKVLLSIFVPEFLFLILRFFFANYLDYDYICPAEYLLDRVVSILYFPSYLTMSLRSP